MEIKLRKTTEITHQSHDYENGFSYVEYWHNSRLKDSIFVLTSGLYPDATIKPGYTKYFYSPTGEKIGKPLSQLTNRAVESFEYFNLLRSIDEDGRLLDFEGNPIVEI